ncbi:MAG: type I glyceraldehyde-3-phosphate dehydrogenase [Anaerolineae bacterium]
MARVTINGLGRIGRATFKMVLDTPGLDLIAVNDIAPVDNLAYLLKYDTAYGRYERSVDVQDGGLVVGSKRVKVFMERDPLQLPWGHLGVDIVFECTGVFTRREDLEKHIRAGAKYAILSAPSRSEDVVTVIHGVNRPGENSIRILSCASCTTNCITPILEIMGRRIGVRKAIMTTLHAYTAGQSLVDAPNKDPRRGRAGAANFVPTSTGAAMATTQALPQYAGKFDGVAVRGPVPVGSLADIVFLTERETTVEEVNRTFQEEAESERYRGIVGVAEDPLVSSDIVKDPRAAVVDLSMTRVVDGDLVKVMAWYDNEWGYASQMVREAVQIAAVLRGAPRG